MNELRYIYYVLFALLMVGCSAQGEQDSSLDGSEVLGGYGSVAISPVVSAAVEVLESRSATLRELPAELLPTSADFTLDISGVYSDPELGEEAEVDTVELSYLSIDAYNDSLPLLYTNSGGYLVQLSSGDPAAEGEGVPYFEGESTIYVEARAEITTSITASLTNSIITLSTGEWFDLYYDEAQLTVTTSAGSSFDFAKGVDERLIFVEAGTTLSLSGVATKTNGAVVSFSTAEIGTTCVGELRSIVVDASQVGDVQITIAFDDSITEIDIIDMELNDEAPKN